MTYILDDKIRYDDSPNIDAFGGLRVSTPRLLGEYRFQYGIGTNEDEFNYKLENDGTFVPEYYRNCVLLKTTDTSGSRVAFQTKQYHPYIAGTSNKYLMTFKMDPARSGLVQYVGAFDDYNGIYFRMNGTTPEVGIRKGNFGITVDNNTVPKTAWNVDRLDGSMNEFNPSGITVDFTKCHILFIDYQWLGVGRVRVGFIINGVYHVVHQFTHANSTTETYIRQPSLPMRYEIVNTSGVPADLMAICSAAYCEGADFEIGYNRSVSTGGGTALNITNSTDGQLILAVRLKNGILPLNGTGHYNNSFARLKEWGVLATSDMHYKVMIFPTSTGFITGANWLTIPGESVCQYAKGHAMVSGWQTTQAGKYEVLVDSYAQGAVGAGSGTNVIKSADNKKNAIYQNYDSSDSEVIAIVGFHLTGATTTRASLVWLEVK